MDSQFRHGGGGGGSGKLVGRIRRPWVACVPLVFLALCTGCGDGRPVATSQDRPTSGSPQAPPLTGTPVVAYGNAEKPAPVRWKAAEPISAGRGLLIRWMSGKAPCHVLDRVAVVFQPQAIVVTVHEGRDPATRNPVCPQIAVTKWTLVKLSEQVQGRRILDGAV